MQKIKKDQWKMIFKIFIYFTFIFFFQRIFADNPEIKPIADPSVQVMQNPANEKVLLINEIDKIESSWAEAYYSNSLKNDEKEKKYSELLEKVETLIQKNPQAAEPVVWKGILYSNIAGVVGPLTALSKAKSAMAYFKDSLALNPQALNGAAFVNLGMMYHQMPWPTGSEEEAEKMFKKALKVSTEIVDANFFYGMFLMDQDRSKEAFKFLEKASQLQPRSNQVFADTKIIEAAKRVLKNKF